MKIFTGHRILVSLVLIVGAVLLGRWAMHEEKTPSESADIEKPAPSADTPAKSEQPAADATAQPARTAKSASNFGTLRGRVIDAATRKPVREFEVEFHGSQATKVGKETLGTRKFESESGQFEWDYLPPGNWAVSVSAAGYQRFDLLGVPVPAGSATPEILLPMRAGIQLRGRVYEEDTGVGIADARVSFREANQGRFEGNWRMRTYVTSSTDGSFTLEGLPAGRVILSVWASDHAGRELEVVVGKTASIEIALSVGSSISGRLTAEDGVTPVSGSAGLFDLDQGFGGTRRTGDAGEFDFRNLEPGRYQLTGKGESGGVAREIVLARNQHIEGLVLSLEAGRTIRGVVGGLRPDDLKRTRISLRRGSDTGNPYAEVGVDERGAYALTGVLPGRVQVVADVTMRRQLVKAVEVPADTDVTANLDFPSGARLSGRITRGGKPLGEVWLEPRPGVEQPVFIYGTATSKDGQYVIEDMANGDYTLWVGDYKSRPFKIDGDTVFDVDVPLAQLSGRVFEEGGKVPVVGAEVVLWSAEPGAKLRLYDSADHFGQFALAGLEPGDYMLTVYKPGYELFRTPIAYQSPVAGMNIRLHQDVGVQIRVREAESGKALDEVYAIEVLGKRDGSRLRIDLDDKGVGFIPSALAGSTLSVSTYGYAPALIRDWNGDRLDLRLEAAPNQ